MEIKSRATLTLDTFAKWAKLQLDFLDIAELRAVKLSPAHKQAWQTAFRLERLVTQRQLARFVHLSGREDCGGERFQSIDDILRRLDQGWTAAEEAELMKSVPAYRDATLALRDLQSVCNPAALADERQLLEHDSKYREARVALTKKTRQLRVAS